MGDRVAVLSPEGQFGTVDAADAEAVTRAGGKVLTKQQLAERATQEAYDKQGLGTKVATVASMAGPIGYPLHAYLRGQGAVLPPELESYTQGVSQGFTGGAASVGMKEIVGAVGGEKAAHAYGETAKEVVDSHAGMHSAGEIAGFLGGAIAGGPKAGLGGAGKLIPGVGIGTIGGAAEGVAARALAPIAARGAIGRALATGGELGARGAVEGSLYAGASQVTEDMLGDKDIAADKMFSAMGTGALYGGVGGAALGGAGSLAASGGRAGLGAARSGISRVLSKGSEVAAEVAADGGALEGAAVGEQRGPGRIVLDQDAGLTRDTQHYPPVISDWNGVGKGGSELGRAQSLYQPTEVPSIFGRALDDAGAARGVGKPELVRGKLKPTNVTLRNAEAELPAGLNSAERPIDIAALRRPAASPVVTAAESVGLKPEAEVTAVRKMLGGDVSGGARDAANTMAFDALGTTRKVADKINKEVEGGTRAVGDYVNRRILKLGADNTTLAGTIRGGRADELLPLIEADKAVIGSSIGDVVKASPVRVAEADLVSKAASIAKGMSSDPTRIQGAQAFTDQVAQSLQALKNGGAIVDGTVDLSEMYYARAKMESVAYEMRRSNSAAGDAMKEWLRNVDAHLVDKIDEAAKAIGDTGAKDKLLGLKREYQLASSAEKAAADGANRIAGNNTYGIREGIGAAVGLATGHPLAAIGAAVGGKMLRERGSAAGAYLLTKMADMGTIARAIKAVDDQIGRASEGILAPPKKGPLPLATPTDTVQARADAAMRRVSEMEADPARIAERAAAAAEPYQNTAPNLASAIMQRMTSAHAFLVSKIPTSPDPDPFDPHPAPKLTDGQAAEYAAYDYYCERPSRFFDEAAHGKLTFEGAEVAAQLMPGAFAQLQQRTIEGLATLMAKGAPPPYLARQRIGMVLDIPAVPEQRADHMGFLQANVIGSENAQKSPLNGAQSPPKRPIPTKTQSSTLDRLEGR